MRAESWLAYLSRDGGAVLKQAAEGAKRGDQEGAKQILSPMMQTPEAQDLVDKINENRVLLWMD